MISVNVKFIDGNVDSLTVSGHALYANPGKDIVCAGVSAVVVGGVNALDPYDSYVKVTVNDESINFKTTKVEKESQIILNTILVQLETIEKSYKKFIKIFK